MLADILALHIGERARDALISVVHRLVDGRAILRCQTVFLIPDVQRCFLERNGIDVLGFDLDDGIHGSAALRLFCSPVMPSSTEKAWSDAPGVVAVPVKTSPDRAILDRLRETQDLVSGSKD